MPRALFHRSLTINNLQTSEIDSRSGDAPIVANGGNSIEDDGNDRKDRRQDEQRSREEAGAELAIGQHREDDSQADHNPQCKVDILSCLPAALHKEWILPIKKSLY